jgi:hypothetical protein
MRAMREQLKNTGQPSESLAEIPRPRDRPEGSPARCLTLSSTMAKKIVRSEGERQLGRPPAIDHQNMTGHE